MGNGRVRVTRDPGHFPVTAPPPPLSVLSCHQATHSPQIVSVTVGFATTGKYEEAGRSDRGGEWRGKEFPGEDDIRAGK